VVLAVFRAFVLRAVECGVKGGGGQESCDLGSWLLPKGDSMRQFGDSVRKKRVGKA